MSTMFERFAEMAKEEFGYTVIKTDNDDMCSFESLFGATAEDIIEDALPYDIPDEQIVYHNSTNEMLSLFNANSLRISTYEFNLEGICSYAA